MTTTPDQNAAITPPPPPPPPPGPDLGRRTILQGAAWTIPAIAATTIAPVAAAASAAPVLTFNQTSYTGVACGTITGAYITVTVGGAPANGVTVTTTLSGGYTFSGGSQYNSQASVNGRVNLPAISFPPQGGSGTLTATANTSVVSASANAPTVNNSTVREPSGAKTTYDFPAGTTSPTGGTFLTPDGDLYLYSTHIASGVVDAYSHAETNVGWWVTYIRADGTGAGRYPDGTSDAVTLTPGTKVVGLSTYLTPQGELVQYINSIASNVASAGAVGQSNVGFWTSWVLANGSATVREPSGAKTTYDFPAGTTSPTGGTFLTPDGDLYLYSTHIASGVVDAYSHAETNVGWWVTYIRADGTGAGRYPDGTSDAVTLTPGTKVVGLSTYLTPQGELVQYINSIASNVASAGAVGQSNAGFWTSWVSKPTC
ncbi:hypothetical protein [Microbacterium sp. SLBN-111]|uniref:hypothetical protein n=1 Tax=Microbacterium sp. SLBN-111 TaxID=3377733 RepID=UPI003C79219A